MFEFGREELVEIANIRGIGRSQELNSPSTPSATAAIFLMQFVRKAPSLGTSWIIEGAGRARYRFRCVLSHALSPRGVAAWIPDATPEIIGASTG